MQQHCCTWIQTPGFVYEFGQKNIQNGVCYGAMHAGSYYIYKVLKNNVFCKRYSISVKKYPAVMLDFYLWTRLCYISMFYLCLKISVLG